jgi:hypothetical protein
MSQRRIFFLNSKKILNFNQKNTQHAKKQKQAFNQGNYQKIMKKNAFLMCFWLVFNGTYVPIAPLRHAINPFWKHTGARAMISFIT